MPVKAYWGVFSVKFDSVNLRLNTYFRHTVKHKKVLFYFLSHIILKTTGSNQHKSCKESFKSVPISNTVNNSRTIKTLSAF